ncbi:MAG: prepilin-type N-terminal cleavage/methylation domain-containing protein [Phycisphaerales bacterium]|nr:prepilin-type N-terminal cleavage/methylation domain-containing protein [Phycisphaerales bacterium]
MKSTGRPRQPRAFSLIELMIVIAIIAIVITLVVVGLRFARDRTRSITDLSKLQQFSAAFAAYGQDYRDQYPYVTKPGFMSASVGDSSVPMARVSYFDASEVWHIPLARPYFSAVATSDLFFPSTFVSDDATFRPFRTPFRYACSFIAEPDYWRAETRLTGTSQLRSTKITQVTAPSRKALIVQGWPTKSWTEREHPPLFQTTLCDGSARAVGLADWVPGYKNGCGNPLENFGAVHRFDNPVMLHTVGGASGFDIGSRQ